jgi:hypothetical protein
LIEFIQTWFQLLITSTISMRLHEFKHQDVTVPSLTLCAANASEEPYPKGGSSRANAVPAPPENDSMINVVSEAVLPATLHMDVNFAAATISYHVIAAVGVVVLPRTPPTTRTTSNSASVTTSDQVETITGVAAPLETLFVIDASDMPSSLSLLSMPLASLLHPTPSSAA